MERAVIRPNLFIVGEPKSGTTALYDYLSAQPGTFMSTPKEPHYFCSDFHEGSDRIHGRPVYYEYRSEAAWLRLFEGAQGRPLVGEASTSYLFSERAADGIHRFNPEARIVAIFREPVAFLASLHSHYLRATLEDAPTLSEAWKLQDERADGRRLPPRVRAPQLVLYRQRLQYFTQLQRFLALFSRAQIHVILFEDFQRDNARTLAELLAFLDLPAATEFTRKEVNRNATPRFQWLNRLLLAPRLKQFFRSRLSPEHYERVIAAGRAILWRSAPRAANPASLRDEIRASCTGQVDALGAFLGRDLRSEWWGREGK